MKALDRDSLRHWVANSFVARCLRAFVAQQGIDRAMVLASQAFTALIPMLILVSALAPTSRRNLVAAAIVRRLHLSGNGAQAVEQVFASSGQASIGILSVALLLFSGISLTRRMQRMYLLAWRIELRPGLRGSFDAALGLGVLIVELALVYLARSLISLLPGDWILGVPLTLLTSLVLWTSVPWLLLNRRVHWRRLLPGGALAAVCASAYSEATAIYMPALVEAYSERYGLFGVTLSLVGWLLCMTLIIVATAIIAAELDRADEPWASRLRVVLGVEASSTATDPGPAVHR